MYYPNLFSERKIGARTVKNRIVSSPVGDNMANTDGSFSDETIAFYVERARGGAGIIMPGAVAVDYPQGKSNAVCQRIDGIKYVKGLNRLARGVHTYGALLIPQLQHAGARTDSEILDGMRPVCVSDAEPENSSIRACRALGPQRELTAGELRDMVPRYVRAARYCQMAECDGVEIHMAHSYLLNELLSPDTNRRTDEYGGSLENRLRLPLEIVAAVRKACGRRFIISARIPGAEFVKNGLTPEECTAIAQALERAGCDVLNVSVGMTVDQTKIKEPQGSPQGARLEAAGRIKKAVSIPVMTAGVFRTPDFCERVIAENRVDFILMARTLICDPHWPRKARDGRADEIRPCLSCNAGCFGTLPEGRPIGCVLNPVTGCEYDNSRLPPAEKPLNLLVIGGGVSGMQAAITAAGRGHRVTLCEKSGRLGGQMNLACVPPDKDCIKKAAQWFAAETVRAGVDVCLSRDVALGDVKALAPDRVIFAAGARPWAPDFPGKQNAIQSWDVLSGAVPMPENTRVAVIGGGLVGCETALLLQKHGNAVAIIEMLPDVAAGLESANRAKLLGELHEGGAEIYVGARVLAMEGTDVKCEKDGREISVRAGAVVLAIGQRPAGLGLAEDIRAAGIPITVVGGDTVPATFAGATRAGYMAACSL